MVQWCFYSNYELSSILYKPHIRPEGVWGPFWGTFLKASQRSMRWNKYLDFMHFFLNFVHFRVLLLPFCGYDWGPGSWFGISKIVQTTLRDEKKFCAISDSTVEGRALRDEWGAWDWRTDRLFAPSAATKASLSSWDQHLSTDWLRSGGKDKSFGIIIKQDWRPLNPLTIYTHIISDLQI